MAKKRRTSVEDVASVVQPNVVREDAERSNGTYSGEKNDRSVITEPVEKVQGSLPKVDVSAPPVTEVPKVEGQVQQGGVPSVYSQESQNGGQAGADINKSVETPVGTVGDTGVDDVTPKADNRESFVNSAVGGKEVHSAVYDNGVKPSFADYGMSKEDYDKASANTAQIGNVSGVAKNASANQLKVWIENYDKIINDPNTDDVTRNAYLASKIAAVDALKAKAGESTPGADIKSPFDGNLFPSADDVNNTVQGTSNNEGISRLEDKLTKKPVLPEYPVKEEDAKQGGTPDGTEKGGQSADGTTPTPKAYDEYDKGVKFAEAYESGRALTGKPNFETNLSVGGEAYAKKLESTRAKIENGEIVPLKDRYELMMADKGRPVGSGSEGDVITESDVEREEFLDKVLEKSSSLGYGDDATRKALEEEYKKDPEAFKKKYTLFLGQQEFSEEMPKLNLPKESTLFYDQMKKYVDENYRESPKAKADREKKNKTLKTLAVIGDVITSVANIWGAAKGATPAKQTSLTGAVKAKEKEEEAKELAKLDKATKLLDDALKKDLEFNKTQRTSALEEYKAMQRAYVERMKAHNTRSQKEWEAKWKEHLENLKHNLAVSLEEKKQENRVELRKMPTLSESHSTRTSTSTVSYNSNGNKDGKGIPKRVSKK